MVELSWFEDYGINDYKGYNMSSLQMDEAYLSISLDPSINKCKIFIRHTECMKCSYVKMEDGIPFLEDGIKIILKRVPYYNYRITTEDVQLLKASDTYLCEFGNDFGEFGIYHAHISTNSCLITTVKKAVSTVFPVLTVLLIYCTLFLCVLGSVYLWKKLFTRESDQRDVETKSQKRILSLDTFRGYKSIKCLNWDILKITITIMIFLHYGGGGYEVLHMSHWNGLHIGDLAFPWFLWIMGACIPISLQSRHKNQIPKRKIWLNILKRSVKLFCLGLFIGSGFNLECLRIFDVLQRIAISYLVVATSCLIFMKREVAPYKHKIWNHFNDILLLHKNWILTLIILFVHCMLIFLVAEDGCPKGYLGPGGLHDDGRYFNCTGGATGYIDRMMLGKHMANLEYSVTKIYHSTQKFEPEGILGSLTSIAQVFVGVQAGTILLVYQKHHDRVKRWLIWGILTGIIGGVLCGFSKNDGIIPINKKLWSTSYVFVTSSFAFFLLSFCYFFNDIKKWWSGKPFLFAGMNSLALYVGHYILRRFPIVWTVFCDEHLSTHLLTLFRNIWSVCAWLLIAYYMYTKNCFIIL